VRAARRHLGELEKQLRPGSSQPDLFSPDVSKPDEGEALREALDGLQPDEMSPKEALEALYRLKRLAE
jgi:DNA mismatch repair protein MutS